ncbi:draxin-B isoform X2 [Electrophorus electricus]|uniref:draxin-B isoform X2 n=1 Tax=Electrophorus electricus TaxID=8005 RepID=UPI0015CF8B8F|nr:draxin-B isoform X2 [Electrophorus electricus]
MATPCWCFLSSLLFAMVAVTQTVDAITESIKNTAEDTTVSYDRSISSVTTVTREEHSSPPSLPSDLQEDSSLDKNVVSILGREFFHWDDWESARLMEKKNRQHIKSSSNGKQAMHLQTIISCEHHLDCVPGSCCNLRKHMCEVQNRGLNNKCYDNWFQCLAKLHHNDRVIQKKGRCVHPEDINISHRIFTAI